MAAENGAISGERNSRARLVQTFVSREIASISRKTPPGRAFSTRPGTSRWWFLAVTPGGACR
ncbi:hypothetical protein A33M_1330 [Rhodovulum sp. PH10]|nr:hypothetical protein A33M_1330 [Rhodovulum sp. PH10]